MVKPQQRRQTAAPLATELELRSYVVRVDDEPHAFCVMATHGLEACRDLAQCRGYAGARHESSIAEGWALAIAEHVICAWRDGTATAATLRATLDVLDEEAC
jgi:hypothetical protein